LLGALALPGSILCAIGAGCEPQDIYLFDEAYDADDGAEVAERDAGGEQSEAALPDDSADSDDAGGPAVIQPECLTEACWQCVEARTCRLELTTFVCHPVTADCKAPCDPEAAAEQPQCPPGEVCDDRGLCVGCRSDADCGPGPTPVCAAARGVCVQCIESSDCSSELPICDVEASLCVECRDDGDCEAAGEVCLAGPQRCVQCRDDDDCGSFDDDNRCLPDEQRCVECIDDDDCASDSSKPFCKLSEHECDDERD
jgi:hypothetical protein